MTERARLEVALNSADVVMFDGERLPASPRIHRLIALLMSKVDTIVSPEELSRHFGWKDAAVSNSAKVAICHARDALKDVGAPVRIETIYGHGYRLRVLG